MLAVLFGVGGFKYYDRNRPLEGDLVITGHTPPASAALPPIGAAPSLSKPLDSGPLHVPQGKEPAKPAEVVVHVAGAVRKSRVSITCRSIGGPMTL